MLTTLSYWIISRWDKIVISASYCWYSHNLTGICWTQPLYGFSSAEHIPFRFASGGGRELHYTEDREMDLTEVINNANVKFPLDVSLRCKTVWFSLSIMVSILLHYWVECLAHWLVIDGIQPTIPENPPPVSKDEQQLECVNPVINLKKKENEKELYGKPTTG